MTKRLIVLAVVVGLAGCGGSGSAPAPPPAGAPADVAPAAPQPPAILTTTPDPYELDPAKHVIPETPAAGRLGGKPFVPDRVEIEGNRVVFRQGKDFFADLQVDVLLFGEDARPEAVKLVVQPGQGVADRIPAVHASIRSGADLPKATHYSEKFALTLELGKKDGGKVPGKIYLSLPDAEKSYLAGTFVAEVVRGMTEPPRPEDVPYIAGTVAHKGTKEQTVTVGYAGLTADGKVVSEAVGSTAAGGGAARSMTEKPRAATINTQPTPAAFDFVRLPPGRYLVAARLQPGGPSAWTWVEVKPGGTPKAELALDPAKVGTVTVKLPAGAKDRVVLTPADPEAEKAGLDFVNAASFVLDYTAEPKDGTATVANVFPGAYTVRYWADGKPLTETVTVAAGKTATVEIKPPAKK